jgi:hypothetical protein
MVVSHTLWQGVPILSEEENWDGEVGSYEVNEKDKDRIN